MRKKATEQMRRAVRAHIERAIAVVGSENKLAEAAGYSQNGLWQARKRGTVTEDLAKAIHRATDGKVTGSDLCPHLWRLPEHVPLD